MVLMDIPEGGIEWTEQAKKFSDELEIAKQFADAVVGNVAKSVIGYEIVTRQVLTSIILGRHALAIGDVGMGKSRFGLSLARTLGLKFGRVHCDPEMRPSMFRGRQGEHSFLKGLLGGGSQLLQVDEIIKLSNASIAALLGPMEEGHVLDDLGQKLYDCPEIFTVFATANPPEGSYSMLEARDIMDRFGILLSPPIIDLAQEDLLMCNQSSPGVWLLEPSELPEVVIDGQINGEQMIHRLRQWRSKEILVPERIRKIVSTIGQNLNPLNGYRTSTGTNVNECLNKGLSNRAKIEAVKYLKIESLLKGRHVISDTDLDCFPYLWASRVQVKPTYVKPQETAQQAGSRLVSEIVYSVISEN